MTQARETSEKTRSAAVTRQFRFVYILEDQLFTAFVDLKHKYYLS
jgi:hypothetical protein